MNTFAETEMLLRTALTLSDNSVKDIASGAGIKVNTLYKWKTNQKVHLSPAKSDALLTYFVEKEPKAIVAGALLNYVLKIIYLYLSSLTEEEVAQEDENNGKL